MRRVCFRSRKQTRNRKKLTVSWGQQYLRDKMKKMIKQKKLRKPDKQTGR